MLAQAAYTHGHHEAADVLTLDAAEAIAAANAHKRPPAAPDRRLTSEQLQKKLLWARDPQKFDLANSQYGFPRPIPQMDANNLLSQQVSSYAWSEAAIDRWIVEQRAKLVGRPDGQGRGTAGILVE